MESVFAKLNKLVTTLFVTRESSARVPAQWVITEKNATISAIAPTTALVIPILVNAFAVVDGSAGIVMVRIHIFIINS